MVGHSCLAGDLTLYRDFLGSREAGAWFGELLDCIPWTQPKVRMFGRETDSPRLAAWFGERGVTYTYSGSTYQPLAWPPTVQTIRQRVERICRQHFNGALINLYRDGRDSMGWHRDDEPGLVPGAAIASVSLGATRRFRLHHEKNRHWRFEIPLEAGSLLVMEPSIQCEWRHSIPREPTVEAARINLTFRTMG
jgi:alkylated DNA repair dioxygenase AlkB